MPDDRATHDGNDGDTAHVALTRPLVERAQAGDAEAFEQLMRLTEVRTARIVWRLLADKQDVRDAMQETYLRAYKYLAACHSAQPFAAWLYRIAVNVCHDFNRRRMNHAQTHEQFTDNEAHAESNDLIAPDDVEADYLTRQQRHIVEQALQSLTTKERHAIVLRDIEGLTTEETAHALGTKPSTVRSQLSSARQKLKLHCAQLLRPNKDGEE